MGTLSTVLAICPSIQNYPKIRFSFKMCSSGYFAGVVFVQEGQRAGKFPVRPGWRAALCPRRPGCSWMYPRSGRGTSATWPRSRSLLHQLVESRGEVIAGKWKRMSRNQLGGPGQAREGRLSSGLRSAPRKIDSPRPCLGVTRCHTVHLGWHPCGAGSIALYQGLGRVGGGLEG